MKNLFSAFVIALGLLTCAAPAQAQTSRIYAAGYLGLNVFREADFSEGATGTDGAMEFKHALSLAGALGLRLDTKWRAEAEISRRSGDIDQVDFKNGSTFKFGGDITTWLYMLNVYYDFDWQWRSLQPFLTAGAGLAGHETQVEDTSGLLQNASDDSLGFAWSMGGGLKYRINPKTALTSNYRYVGSSDIEADTYDIEYSAHEIRLGLEYDLPATWFTRNDWFD